MSLVNCPDCEKPVSNEARRCPHCGLESATAFRRTPRDPIGHHLEQRVHFRGANESRIGQLVSYFEEAIPRFLELMEKTGSARDRYVLKGGGTDNDGMTSTPAVELTRDGQIVGGSLEGLAAMENGSFADASAALASYLQAAGVGPEAWRRSEVNRLSGS